MRAGPGAGDVLGSISTYWFSGCGGDGLWFVHLLEGVEVMALTGPLELHTDRTAFGFMSCGNLTPKHVKGDTKADGGTGAERLFIGLSLA